ncbi:MAG TPA: hypothetical protein VE262_25320 [Blastocatellia bacterium]|nr:hypothetical protein [Blastocatellia bacterium]
MNLLEEEPTRAGTVSEICLDKVDPSDRIVIETRNSLYQFSVMDANQRRGVLSGGPLSEGIRDAVLMGTLSSESGSFKVNHLSLRTNARAFFFIKSSDGVERLITSAITSLTLIKSDLGTPSFI